MHFEEFYIKWGKLETLVYTFLPFISIKSLIPHIMVFRFLLFDEITIQSLTNLTKWRILKTVISKKTLTKLLTN